ncbi:MAG: long-chain fatty acid--CoA ligase [Bacteroidales bacterium]|nr:long-chain fatty acid--CoA ligase [Bacteroidales bacterium]
MGVVNYISIKILHRSAFCSVTDLWNKKKENIASIFSGNKSEWNIIDMAVAQIGAVHVPVYPTISDSDYLFILNQTEVRIIFVSDQTVYNKISGLIRELPKLEKLISIEKLTNVEGMMDFINAGARSEKINFHQLESIKKNISADDICTIIYTSGTTGLPKGVLLSHRNLCTNFMAAAERQPLGSQHKILSFLPLWHIYERTAVYQFLYKGTMVYYAENLKSLLANMQEIHPDGTTVVPRVLEKILKGLISRSNESFVLKKLLINWCVKFGCRYDPANKRGFYYKLRHFFTDILVFRAIRSLLGGKIKYVGMGGAPVSEKVERFFWAAGVPVFQGYGLTECSPLISLNYNEDDNMKLGTVGPLIPKVEVKIAEDGEIMVKGPNVMKGYYKNNELTNESFEKGFLHTGDLGEIIDNRFLKITGRKKEMFKTSYGKYIVPQAIESRFIDCPYINHIMIVGEGKHYAAAIISPNFEYFRKIYYGNMKISNENLIVHPEIIKRILQEIRAVNKKLGKTEQIRKHLLVSDVWSPESGEISITQKLRRNILLQKYAHQIHELYIEDSPEEIE